MKTMSRTGQRNVPVQTRAFDPTRPPSSPVIRSGIGAATGMATMPRGAKGTVPHPRYPAGRRRCVLTAAQGPWRDPMRPHSGCLSGVALSYSLISLADQLMLSGKRHAGVVVRYVPSFLARESASWCLEKYKSFCSWGSSVTL